MAHKTEDGTCPIATNIFIRKQAEKRKISIRKMIEDYSKEAEIPIGTLNDWIWPKEKTAMETHSTSKPTKSHTKPEVKIQLNGVAVEIKDGGVSDDDAKVLADAIAEQITTGKMAARVGSRLETAAKKNRKKRKGVKPKEIDNYRKLWDHVLASCDGLRALAEGIIPTPQLEEEAEAAIGIKSALPDLCLQLARLGVDLIEINEVYYKQGETNNGSRKKIEHINI